MKSQAHSRKNARWGTQFPVALVTLALSLLAPSGAEAKNTMSAIEAVQRSAEMQVRNLLEPLLDKYCRDECKLMSVSATVDLQMPEEIAPGFDDIDPRGATKLAASSARVKLLMDEKVGPISRGKLMDLIQQYLDTLDYPVRVETQLAHFPQPVGNAGKVAELREKISKTFRNTLDDLFRQFCAEQCMLADFDLQTEVVNAEEAQYGSTGEFFEEGGVAIRVKNISGTILVDDELQPEERNNVLEMAKLKTNHLKNVTLTARSMRFPRPTGIGQGLARGRGGVGGGVGIDAEGNETNRSLASESKATESIHSEKKDTLQQNQTSTSNSNSTNASNTNTNNTNSSNETNARQERFERIEKIERVESGDAVQQELQKFKVFGLIFACSVISLLIFLAMSSYRPRSSGVGAVQRVIQQIASDPVSNAAPSTYKGPEPSANLSNDERNQLIAKRYEIERLTEELMGVYAQQPKVAKQVFTRVLTEEGIETTAQYIHLFGESIVVDMIRDPSLQADINELMEFYAKNPIELNDDEKLELLRKLHNRTIAGKLVVMGSRSTNLFDFLADMDGLQILELIRNESMTVKSIVMTQCDSQKRAAIYSQLEDETRMKLMTELSRIDYLPRDYISNVANALKRKRRENPRLNTEALPGSDVLLTLLERTGGDMQRVVMKNLEMTNPDSARTIKSKLVSIDTLRFLRDGQLLEVVLSLRHDELLQFLKGAPEEVKKAIFAKSPKELVSELEEELENVSALSREAYLGVERKVLNRMKLMANEGLINLVETNERMLAESGGGAGFVEAGPADATQTTTNVKKVAGW